MSQAAARTPRLGQEGGVSGSVPVEPERFYGPAPLATVCVDARLCEVQVRREQQAAGRRIGLIAARIPVVELHTGTGVLRHLHLVYGETDPADPSLPAALLLTLTPKAQGNSTGIGIGTWATVSLTALVGALEDALRDHPGNMRLMAHIALAMRALLSAAAPRANGVPSQPRLSEWQLRRALSIMEVRFGEALRIPEVAAACALSQGYFARAFLVSTGKTPYRWLLERRVRAAQQLLSTTQMSLTEVGLACGFAEQSHFTRNFRNAVGVPPGIWRRSRSSLAWDHAEA